jgi:hypothetical protein
MPATLTPKGVEDYFKYVNDTKILGDDKIDCTIRDDQYKTDVTKRNFEDFLDEGIVFYLNYSTGSTLALKKDFEEEKMPTIPASFHAGNLVDSNYIFPAHRLLFRSGHRAGRICGQQPQGRGSQGGHVHPSLGFRPRPGGRCYQKAVEPPA